ncbi:bis(5'-nucleosyl)-tetraphosphatase (symmetrical) YqeK [Paenibacillus sp. MZ04-78.2]|uniref:bis(5'-nucleosyl)-tetraphosphatase (symmetrical) YqeK n=1 Tax=Paenibacillus sp. MZ04-78.2 TaxID=2962034 RepID=UPI0020B8F790|nr:bis(5'-nucleosyl)-tetraphosphatase (symmetrical) YqeK [Paenibacillus sp. MZ04-78.2]MCP3775776.1 bis(5'-nucleosyl)-tetraphosphatase (symmetrical) YqeK [Paenibacillus sp. MZ04-78.2]
MSTVYREYINGTVFTGEIKQDIEIFLINHNEESTYHHTLSVLNESVRVANIFGVDIELATQAALLHDVSKVIPKTDMMRIAQESNIKILEDECHYHRIIHQKLSKDMASKIFGCTNTDVLEAIECHTTLKAGANILAKVLFVSDKISWDLPGDHPYQEAMRSKLENLDLDGAALVYLDHVWGQRDKLKLVHPWLIEARDELMLSLNDGYESSIKTSIA